jgi:two-component system, NarL family, sensor histidine kinase UhpB
MAPASDPTLSELQQLRDDVADKRRQLALLLDREERRRSEVALELQEDAAQALAGVLLGIGAIKSDRGAAKDPERLEGLRSSLETTVVALRRLATALRPAVLDHLGLEPALERLAEQHSFAIDVSIAGRLPEDIETVVYRVVEDAMELVDRPASVIVHADATEVRLRILAHRPAGEGNAARFGGVRGRLDTVDGELAIECDSDAVDLRARIPRRA